jgi:hypothetical protein
MAQAPRRRERRGSAEASAGKPLTGPKAKTAMETFKDFARKLLMVPRASIEEEERRYKKRPATVRKKRRRRKSL